MDTTFRTHFNQAFSPARYHSYKQRLESEVGTIPYRLAETPLFLPPYLRDRLMEATRDIVSQLAEPTRMVRLRKAVPAHFDVPAVDDSPSCMTVDFALVKGADGRLDGRVIELQAFPSIYAFTMVQARLLDRILQETPGFPKEGFHCFGPGFDFDSGARLLKDTVLGGEDPEHVVLLEIEPNGQKTRPDFVATQSLTGVAPVCVTEVLRRGAQLYRKVDGREVPIRRVFNRVVFDEWFRKKPQTRFAFTDPLELSWCPHPNWYWMWSKYALPVLEHPLLPRTRFVSELEEVPEDLSAFVLKPLFSFAGAGVVVDPTPADVARIPEAERGDWILQEKVTYARDLLTPDGAGVAAEIRILCLKPPGAPLPVPFMNLVRLSRGKMLGVDQNKDFDWVGSSVALWPRGS
jgi:hypothetical protein